MTPDRKQLGAYLKSFEDCVLPLEGVECWRARDIMPLLGYTNWRQFREAITRAWESCKQTGDDPAGHFLVGDGSAPWDPAEVFEVNLKNPLGGRPREDVLLTRRAAYLVAMNGDPRKEQVAFAQHYFASATRSLEIILKRMEESDRLQARSELAKTETAFTAVLYERGVGADGVARIRSNGDKVLFGGNNTEDMKRRWKVPAKRPIADFAPRVVIIAKELATELTTINTHAFDLLGEEAIDQEHRDNNQMVRDGLAVRHVVPEKLPPAEDVKKVQRRHDAELRRLAAGKAKGRTS